MRPDDDPNVPQFHLHPFSNDRYDYYDNNENDIQIRLDKPEYVNELIENKLSSNAKRLLNEFMHIEDRRNWFTKWSRLAFSWCAWYDTLVEKNIPDYDLLQ